jgi:hypothetical protein
MQADGNSFPVFSLGWTIGGSAPATGAVSSALAGNIGEGVRRGRRTRQPGAAVLPIPKSAFRMPRGQRGAGRTHEAGR